MNSERSTRLSTRRELTAGSAPAGDRSGVTGRTAAGRRAKEAVLIAVTLVAVLATACDPATRTTGTTMATNPVTNPAYLGQCTWGAEEMWHRATGSYLAVRGDAWEWATTAASFNWTVTTTPSDRAIVVFGRGVAGAHTDTGHVAWVMSVMHRADGPYLEVQEMNWTYGPYGWDTRILKAAPGMSYILAP